MSEKPRDERSYGLPACRSAWDSVDGILADWSRERPDLDFSPVGIVTRLARVRTHLDASQEQVFVDHDLTAADFVVIVTLRRSGAPFVMPQARLMEALGLTSGTVSVRLNRLARIGVIDREPDPTSARSVRVRLTDKGVQLFDAVAPAHLHNEDRLLSALDADGRSQLSDLLRRLLASFEAGHQEVASDLGLRLEPAHTARLRRLAVGMSDTPGLLVSAVQPASSADRAGVVRGDLIVAAAGVAVRSSVGLAGLLDGVEEVTLTVLRGEESLHLTLRRLATPPAE